MTRTLSAEELAGETGVSRDRIDWLATIGILRPRQPGTFRPGDIFRVKLIEALLEGGFTSTQIERATADGFLNLSAVDNYLPLEPGPLSERSFGEFLSKAGPRAARLPALYEVMGLPQPDPSSPINVDEEAMFERFLQGWSRARSDEALVRAARLIAEAARMAALGWAELVDEQVAGPARDRILRGEINRFPEEISRAIATLVRVAPRMIEWLIHQYLEHRSTTSIVEGFERFLASRDLGPPPRPTAPPAVVFVDLTGYTRLTEEHGDEVAVRFASTLQRQANAVATANGGRLVKLLGDGAMLRFPDARRGLEGALGLVRALSVDGSLPAHGGVHAGPVIERDLDLFGRTVNLASRIAEVAGPGEVLVSEAVVEAVDDPAVRFERADGASLKGIAEPVPLFRVMVRE